MDKKLLLKTIQRWNIKFNPEYRGFRCANYQKYIHKAWHIWFSEGGFKCEVHLCKNCYKKYAEDN